MYLTGRISRFLQPLWLFSVLAVILIATGALAAGELVGSRPAGAFAGGSVGFYSYGSRDFDSTSSRNQAQREMPDAFLIYSGDGASFYVHRVFAQTMADTVTGIESVPIKIPANSAITIPAPPYFLMERDGGTGDTNRYEQRLYFSASSVTDSVYVVPFFR